MKGTPLIKTSDITLETLSSLLDEAVIGHEPVSDREIYVTGLSFNFWVWIDADQSFVTFSTYWNLRTELSELETLRCLNALNRDLMMLQFFVGANPERLCGHYALPIHDGLDRRQFLHTVRMFADIFTTAVQKGEHRDLIEAWPPATEQNNLVETPPKLIH